MFGEQGAHGDVQGSVKQREGSARAASSGALASIFGASNDNRAAFFMVLYVAPGRA